MPKGAALLDYHPSPPRSPPLAVPEDSKRHVSHYSVAPAYSCMTNFQPRKMRSSCQSAHFLRVALRLLPSKPAIRSKIVSASSSSPLSEETLSTSVSSNQITDFSLEQTDPAVLSRCEDLRYQVRGHRLDNPPNNTWNSSVITCSTPISHSTCQISGDTPASAVPSIMNSSIFPKLSCLHEVVIALGSNMGDRVETFDKALNMMKKAGVQVVCHAGLYESAPAYVTDQPKFLNSAVRARTNLDPRALLGVLKDIERSLGRIVNGVRYGPRPIDLDILFYGDVEFSDESLTLPHPRIWERPFVVAPLMDLYNSTLCDGNNIWIKRFEKAKCAWQLMGGDTQLCQDDLKRVLPIGGKLWQWSNRTYIMGILNITPDSFSDGGKYLPVQNAVAQAEALAAAGADIIDLGAQSTRPFATKLTSDEELKRLIPVVDAIKKLPSMESVWLSVDTFHSEVAKEAVKHGVHMVNDVSGGHLDPEMYSTVAKLCVPYIMMHMRGDPATMLQEKNILYKNVSADVGAELCNSLSKAESSGIPAWRIVVDPGIGFSKTCEQNVQLLGDLSGFRSGLASWSLAATKMPMLLGPSRKRFLGKICELEKAEDRDIATIGAVVAGIAQGADIVRVHNVKASIDAIRVADAIFKTKGLTRSLK